MTPFNIENHLLNTSVLEFILIILIGFIFYLISIIYTNQLKVANNISFSKFICSRCYFEYNLSSFFNLIIISIKGYSCINCKRKFSNFSLFQFVCFITLILFYFIFFNKIEALFFSILLVFLFSIILIDYEIMIINIENIIAVSLLGFIYKILIFNFGLYLLMEMILGFLLGWAIIFTISYVYKFIRGEEGFGSGDKWLLGALGLWFGYSDIILIFFQSCIIATIYIVILDNNFTKKIPIGSFFCVTSISYLFHL